MLYAQALFSVVIGQMFGFFYWSDAAIFSSKIISFFFFYIPTVATSLNLI